MSLLWIFLFLVAERLFELFLSQRHIKALRGRGGREFYRGTFPAVVALHTLFLVVLLIESYPWHLVLNQLTIALLGLLVLLQLFRYWCMGSLGVYWNTRIVVVPGSSVIKKGPYRWIRHPNYFIVVLEFILLPLLMHAPFSFLVFFPGIIFGLRDRIRNEEKALTQWTNYTV